MTRQRVNFNDIIAGEPLPADLYDTSDHLLLSKGHIVADEEQVAALIDRGVFFDSVAQKPAAAFAARHESPSSALYTINTATERLGRLLCQESAEQDFSTAIHEVAKQLYLATEINPNVVAACVLLNQHADYALRHCIDTASISLLIARTMNHDEKMTLSLVAAGLTMDIAMIRREVKPAVEDEIACIQRHPQQGVEILKEAGVDDEAWLDCVLSHHECEDGNGYPHGRKGGEIPLSARIVSTSAAYCARVSSTRHHKAALPSVALCNTFLGKEKTLAPVFFKALGLYPPGAFVRLVNGEIGVVSKVGASAITPYVHALVGPRGAPLAYPIKRDTKLSSYAIREPVSREEADIRFSMKQIWGEDASL